MALDKQKPALVYILLLFILFQGLSGLLGGIGLIMDPTGKSLQIPISWLVNSPFNDYLIPGFILLSVLGIFPIIILYRLWNKLIWSWFFTIALGIALIIWILVEILIIGYQTNPPLQLIYGFVGLIILGLALVPSVKRYCQNTSEK